MEKSAGEENIASKNQKWLVRLPKVARQHGLLNQRAIWTIQRQQQKQHTIWGKNQYYCQSLM
jgi:dTDP-4-dehydrorhamnose reductase